MIEAALAERLDHIDSQLAQLSTALTGNPTMGHRGIVERIENLELLRAEVPETHKNLEERIKAGDHRAHKRVDTIEQQWNQAKYLGIGMVLGAGLVGGGAGAVIVNLFG